MSSLADAINHAKEASKEIIQSAATEIIEATPRTTFVKPSMAVAMASTKVIPRNVAYLKVNEFGIRIGKSMELLSGFKASIDMVEDRSFQLKWTVRFGNPAQYLSTYDGTLCDKGGSWHDALRKASNAGGDEPYLSVDVVMTLLEDIKLKDGLLLAGTKLGFNASKTNFSEWVDFVATVSKAELMGHEVPVNIGFRAIDDKKNVWGVLTFELDA